MDKELDTEEIRRFIAMVDARAIVYSKSFNEKFIKSISDGDTGIRYFIPITPAYDSSFDNKVIAFEQLLTCGRERVERDGYHYPIVRNREKLAEMLFTSGTTGTSKCVMLCQKNIFAAVNAADCLLLRRGRGCLRPAHPPHLRADVRAGRDGVRH